MEQFLVVVALLVAAPFVWQGIKKELKRAEGERWIAERKKEEIAEKRRKLRVLQEEARGEKSYLDRDYREQVAHGQYHKDRGFRDELKQKVEERLAWFGDEDFDQLVRIRKFRTT